MKYARMFEILTVAFDESTTSRTQVQLWYNLFKEGREDVNKDARPNPTDENIEEVRKISLDNRRITIREVADDVGITFGSWQASFMDALGMKRRATKIVPKLLNFEQNAVDDVEKHSRFAQKGHNL